MLQTRVSFSEPSQEAPPLAASVIFVLVRTCCPVPQVLEQAVQSSKAFHLQSTATKYYNNNDNIISNVCVSSRLL